MPKDVEIVGYGGKDALKNTQVLQFMLARLEKVFITFDLDARNEVVPKLTSIGLVEGRDFCAVGVSKPGRECIEGLLPESILSEVYAAHVQEVRALGSTDSKARKSAKSTLKTAAIEKFKNCSLSISELPEMEKLMRTIAKAF